MNKDFFSAEELAALWGVPRQSVYTWIRRGELPALKLGRAVRISSAAVAAFPRPAAVTPQAPTTEKPAE